MKVLKIIPDIENIKTHLSTIFGTIAYLLVMTLLGVIFRFDDGFFVHGGQHPRVLRLHIQRKIHIQTTIILDSILSFSKVWDKEITEKVVWPKNLTYACQVKAFCVI